VIRHHDEDVTGPGIGVAAERSSARLGRARHQVTVERLGREAVELREPLGALGWGLVVVSDTRKDDDASLYGFGITAGLGRLAPQGRQGAPVLLGARKRGTQPSPTAAARRRAAALAPPNHNGIGADAGSCT